MQNHHKGSSIFYSVSHRLLTLEAGAHFHVGSVMDKVLLGHVSFQFLLFSTINITIMLLHIYSYVTWGLDKGRAGDPVPQRHSLTPLEIYQYHDKIYFHINYFYIFLSWNRLTCRSLYAVKLVHTRNVRIIVCCLFIDSIYKNYWNTVKSKQRC